MTWSTPDGVRALTVACPRCEAEPGAHCKKALGFAKNPHLPRVRLGLAVAAHADPLLDEFEPPYGPCGICGVPGLTQRHRIVDAIAGRLAGGEDAGEVAADYLVSPGEGGRGGAVEKVDVVERWMKAWPGAWR